MILLHPEILLLSPLAILVGFLLSWEQRHQLVWQKNWNMNGRSGQSVRPWLLATALLLGLLALARPVWDPQPVGTEAEGQDTVFLVDVSRSMLTGDLDHGQNRLDAVKQALNDLVPDLAGDQVALVAFAGTTVAKCPLTTDLGYFRQAVGFLDPESTARGGTMIGDALRQVKHDFVRKDRHLAIWVFTDGGDQESFPVEAVRDLADTGTRVFIWGVGSLSGGQIPGQNISSVLNEVLLKQVAATLPDSAYWGAESPLWRLNQAYQSHKWATSVRKSTQVVWQEGSWWLLWPILLLVVLAYPPRHPRWPDWRYWLKKLPTFPKPGRRRSKGWSR